MIIDHDHCPWKPVDHTWSILIGVSYRDHYCNCNESLWNKYFQCKIICLFVKMSKATEHENKRKVRKGNVDDTVLISPLQAPLQLSPSWWWCFFFSFSQHSAFRSQFYPHLSQSPTQLDCSGPQMERRSILKHKFFFGGQFMLFILKSQIPPFHWEEKQACNGLCDLKIWCKKTT